jgi:hypothetical protein
MKIKAMKRKKILRKKKINKILKKLDNDWFNIIKDLKYLNQINI